MNKYEYFCMHRVYVYKAISCLGVRNKLASLQTAWGERKSRNNNSVNYKQSSFRRCAYVIIDVANYRYTNYARNGEHRRVRLSSRAFEFERNSSVQWPVTFRAPCFRHKNTLKERSYSGRGLGAQNHMHYVWMCTISVGCTSIMSCVN